MTATQAYTLGHSATEIQRLMFQSTVIRPITERMLQDAGIAPGMHVLDLGSGAGDVALLAAEKVGPGGRVVGIDRNPEVLNLARERAAASGYENIAFHVASEVDYRDDRLFDMVVGRYVLLHQADPAAFLRAAASHVCPGGVLAIHDTVLHDIPYSQPEVALWQHVMSRLSSIFRAITASPDAGTRLVEHFQQAGLPLPRLFCELPIGSGADSPFYTWCTETLRTLLPHAERLGIYTAAEIGLDSLTDRLREQIVAAHAQMLGPHQYCAWARL